MLAADLLIFIEHRVRMAKVNADIPTDKALDDTRHDRVLLCIEFLKDGLALLFTDLLQNDILRARSRDAPEFLGFDFNAYHIPDLKASVNLMRVSKRNLLQIILNLINDRLLGDHMVIAGVRIDRHIDIVCFPEVVLGCDQQCVLDRFE